jgi:3-oxoacyl-(acyl-carrier-protein) synthase
MHPLRELLAVNHRQTLEFFLTRLQDVSDATVSRQELLYNASLLAHYAQVSTHTGVDMPAPGRSMTRTAILGTGAYAPEKVLTNADLERMVATSDAWITERTGIKERRIAAPGEVTSDMAVKASIRALEMARTRPEELDLIIVGTISPDMPMPSCAVMVQAKLGAKKAFAFDLSAACAGSIYAMSIADQYIQTGKARRALVVGGSC